MPQDPAPPRSICLLRLSALGDACHCVAMVRALQKTWPEATITWIIGPGEYRLVGDLPGIEFIVFDKRRPMLAVQTLRRKLAGHRFDALLLAQVSARASLVSLNIRARRRVGFDRARSREGHSLFINERIAAVAFQHQADAMVEFARHLGANEPDFEDRRLPIPDAARAFALEHQPQAGQAVLISPASSHAGRNWHPSGYARVADRIIDKHARPVILIGGPSSAERELGDAIAGKMRHEPIDLIGKDTLKQALAMIDRAACLITPDAGPAHFAAALGTPVIGLYAATWSRRSGPLGSLEHCVDRFAEASRKHLGREPETVRWGRRLEFPGVMDLIEPEAVIDRLDRLLAAPPAET